MTLAEMKARLLVLRALIGDLATRADSLTDDDLSKYDELKAERTKLEAGIELKEDAEKEEERAANEAAAQNATQPTAGQENRAGSVEVGRNLLEDDPGRGYASPRDMLRDVIVATTTGQMSPALRSLRVEPGSVEARTVGSDEQSGSNNPFGGFMLPEAFSPTLASITPETDPTASLVRQFPMEATTVRFNALLDKNHTSSVSGGFTVARRAEAAAIASSRGQMEQVTYTAHSLDGLAFATDEIMMDSPISFASIISDGMAKEFPAKLFDERLNGSGTGEYEGINNCPAMISIAEESSQTTTTIVRENIVKMRARCWGYGNAIWLANHDCYEQLDQLQNADNSPAYVTSVVPDRPDMLLGRPIFYSEFMNTLGAAGDIILGNWGEFWEGTYLNMKTSSSVHVRFENSEQAFKFSMRNDGRTPWRSALTPKNSTATLSPFVRIVLRDGQ